MALFLALIGRAIPKARAQVFSGPPDPLVEGFSLLRGRLEGLMQGSLRDVVFNILKVVLDIVGFLAVVMIIIAGVRLIVSQGEEDAREKAKKTILYVAAGLLVIIFSRVIISFIIGIVTPTA